MRNENKNAKCHGKNLIFASATFTYQLTRFHNANIRRCTDLFPNFDLIFANSDRNLQNNYFNYNACSASKNFNNLSSSSTKIGNYQKYL